MKNVLSNVLDGAKIIGSAACALVGMLIAVPGYLACELGSTLIDVAGYIVGKDTEENIQENKESKT